jgi:hypothetical protein
VWRRRSPPSAISPDNWLPKTKALERVPQHPLGQSDRFETALVELRWLACRRQENAAPSPVEPVARDTCDTSVYQDSDDAFGENAEYLRS